MKFSIAMCTYNGARYLREQLESIAAQTRLPDELIICDDLSGDETREIIKDFASKTTISVRFYLNQKNLGIIKNFEKAIELCTGDIIALCDQDDVWKMNKIERLEQIFLSMPDVGLVFSDADVVDENLRWSGQQLWQFTFPPQIRQLVEEGGAVDVLVKSDNFVTGATMAFKSKFKDIILPIPTGIFVIHDGWIALMIGAAARIAFIPDTLIKYRQHPGQQMGAQRLRKIPPDNAPRVHSRVQSLEKIALHYQTELELYCSVRERLVVASRNVDVKKNTSAIESNIAYLKEKVTHFQTRARMPKSRLGRIPYALRELSKLHYHRYSNGIYSFAKDVLL